MGWTASRPFGTATRSGERLRIAVAVGAMGTLGFAMTSPILPDLATELDVSRGAVGLVQAATAPRARTPTQPRHDPTSSTRMA